jgi:hypothetical protein
MDSILKQYLKKLNLTELGFIHKFWPKRFRKIDSRRQSIGSQSAAAGHGSRASGR